MKAIKNWTITVVGASRTLGSEIVHALSRKGLGLAIATQGDAFNAKRALQVEESDIRHHQDLRILTYEQHPKSTNHRIWRRIQVVVVDGDIPGRCTKEVPSASRAGDSVGNPLIVTRVIYF